MLLFVQVVDVAYNATLKYLMLRLSDDTSQQQLESIVPDCAAMMRAAEAEHITGVIVTCLGGEQEVA